MFYIGIDLAWTYEKDTGICIINEKKSCVYLEAAPFSNEEISQLIEEYPKAIVSVDAPLVVENENGGRACDSLLMKTPIHGKFLKLYATSRTYMIKAYEDIRGEKIRALLKDFEVIETYPTGIFLSLLPELFDQRYKLSSKKSLEDLIKNGNQLLEGIRSLGFQVDVNLNVKTKKAYKIVEDQLDAILCAVNSYYYHHRQYIKFSCDSNGAIVLPQL